MLSIRYNLWNVRCHELKVSALFKKRKIFRKIFKKLLKRINKSNQTIKYLMKVSKNSTMILGLYKIS